VYRCWTDYGKCPEDRKILFISTSRYSGGSTGDENLLTFQCTSAVQLGVLIDLTLVTTYVPKSYNVRLCRAPTRCLLSDVGI
jgi:hypothetical protein